MMEANIGYYSVNGTESVSMRDVLKDFGHPQQLTQIQLDNNGGKINF